MPEQVILVDEQDRPIGAGEKLEVHQKGLLHRAFSIFIFDDAGRLLLQRRAAAKYHSPNLWTNTCCGHPRPGEDTVAGGSRRLKEEFGFSCPLREVSAFRYLARFDNGLTESEITHILVGRSAAEPEPDPGEIGQWKWENFSEVCGDVTASPDTYTVWFRKILTDPLQLQILRAQL